jgi:DNA-3-methyladenine glycosylase I
MPESKKLNRCSWVTNDPLIVRYHDEEWGTPVHNERHLFGLMVLEGAQAGLNWMIILRRREGYRAAFAGFDPTRNRKKIESAINNARAYIALRKAGNTLDRLMWSFVGGKPIVNRWKDEIQIPASTPESDAMSKAMKKAGFTFFGTTICYAHMQAAGMVNDHLVTCFRHRELLEAH